MVPQDTVTDDKDDQIAALMEENHQMKGGAEALQQTIVELKDSLKEAQENNSRSDINEAVAGEEIVTEIAKTAVIENDNSDEIERLTQENLTLKETSEREISELKEAMESLENDKDYNI